jgi:hypothetical protein
VAKPQQPELHRSGLTPADPASAKSQPSGSLQGGQESIGPVPEDNTPGHHPEQEQDKPVEAFVARARDRTRQARAAALEEAADGPAVPKREDGQSGRAAAPGADAMPDRPPAMEQARSRPVSGTSDRGASVSFGSNGLRSTRPRLGPLDAMPGIPVEVVFPGLALLDASRQPESAWDEIGESRAGWMTRIVVFAWLGAWRYIADVKPRLEAARRVQDFAGG